MDTPTDAPGSQGTDEHEKGIEVTSHGVLPPDAMTGGTDPATVSYGNTNNKEQQQDDAIEKSLGITEYFSEDGASSGFSGVVKARYSDFLVHEVHLNGTIARLTSTTIPAEDALEPTKHVTEENGEEAVVIETEIKQDGVKKKEGMGTEAEAAVEDGKNQSSESMEPASVDLESQLAAMINDAEIAKQVMMLLESHSVDQVSPVEGTEKTAGAEKFVTLPALEKAQRKLVHEWVRSSLQSGRADTLDGRIRIWHVKFEKEMPNYKTFGTSKRVNSNNTSSSSNKKAKRGWPADRPDFLQFVLYKENLDTTTATRELSQRGSRARIGYAGMKDKRGVTSQFCTLYRTTAQQIVSLRQQAGGGNTKQGGCSVVQVGNFEYVPRELQLGMLQGNRFDIILRHVRTFRDGAICHGEEERRRVLEGAAQSMRDRGFINYFGTQRFGKFNDTHLVGIEVLRGDFRKAVDILLSPKPEDRPDVAQARKDWQERFRDGESKEKEGAAAHRVLKRFNRFMTAEIAIVQCLARHPMDYKRAFGCIPKNLRMMYIHAVQSLVWNRAASYRIGRMDRSKAVVGDLVSNGGEGSTRVRVVTEDDVANSRYTIEDIMLPLVGNMTVYPTNEVGDVVNKALEEIGVTMKLFRRVQDRDLVVNGDYRKVVCRPRDFDYSIQEYHDPFQPLLQTDLMKLQGVDIVIEPKKDEETAKVAMIVGFTLPSSSYATVALRELMKRPTSNEFQKELKLE